MSTRKLTDEERVFLSQGIYARLGIPPEIQRELEMRIEALMSSAKYRRVETYIAPDGERLMVRYVQRKKTFESRIARLERIARLLMAAKNASP